MQSNDDLTNKKLTETITLKVSHKEKERIQEKAAKCGLTVSSYMRLRGLDYKPKSALTPEELTALQNLDGCRVDIQNYANALHGMDKDKRKAMFQNVHFMYQWYKQVVPITNDVINFINSVKKRIEDSHRTTENI